MAGDEPSPKRRRTDNLAVSADDIDHTNPTLRFFTGQRQNRWMQGYVAPPSGPASVHQTTVRSVGAPVRPNQRPDDHTANTNPSSSPNAAGAAMTAFRVKAHVRRHSIDKTHMLTPQAGLLSPVTGEDTGLSNVASSTMTNHERVPTAGPSNTSHAHAHMSTSTTNSTMPQVNYPGRSAPSPVQILRVDYAAPTWTALPQQGLVNYLPQALAVVPPQLAVPKDDNIFSQSNLTRRLDEYFAGKAASIKLTDVENGRLALLRDALLQGDMFFIVLNQIQALRNWPELIPESAKKRLEPQCFSYLDRLLAGNDHVSLPVLTWLSAFPAPILKIYFSPPAAKVYETHVTNVVAFLSRLPQYWDPLEFDCRSRTAPPLVQEMVSILQLPSPVLQTTIFRAIARVVINAGSFNKPEVGYQLLEHLHRIDQAAFLRGHRKNPADLIKAHRAFADTIAAWRRYEEATAQQGPNPRLPQQALPPFQFPIDVMKAFPTIPQTMKLQHIAPQGPSVQSPMQQQNAAALQHGQAFTRGSHDVSADYAAVLPVQDRVQHEILQQHAGQRSSVSLPSSEAQQQHGSIRPLFPRHGDSARAQPTQPDTNRSALHQAHLRSPRFVASATSPTNQPGPLLYRHVAAFALPPTKINKDEPIQSMRFDIPPYCLERIPKYMLSSTPGEVPSCELTEASETYRLRCATSPAQGFPGAAAWVVADYQWPDNMYLELNGEMLEPRRKLHHNRYLPIDLSAKIRSGENHIKVIINRVSNDPRPFEYSLAVERVEVVSHAAIIKSLTEISAEDSLAMMKAPLINTGNDDDVAITSSNLIIQLFDPYSTSKIFDLPVRGSACRHKDCFDLETFLGLCKRPAPGSPTVVDCWRCPICRGDVRPQTLIIDGFLMDVRKQLEAKGLLDTRAIAVEADGSWRPKAQELLGVRSPSLEREERGDSATSGMGQREVIEID